MRIKETLDTAANAFIILVCLFFMATFGTQYWRAQNAAAANPAGARPRPYALGESAAALAPLNFAASDRTLVLVFRSGCRYCTESVPFYQRLAARVKGSARGERFVGVTTDRAEVGRSYLASHALEIQSLMSIDAASLRVGGTPTLILVNRSGQIQRIWRGKLPPSAEAEVIAETFGAGN